MFTGHMTGYLGSPVAESFVSTLSRLEIGTEQIQRPRGHQGDPKLSSVEL